MDKEVTGLDEDFDENNIHIQTVEGEIFVYNRLYLRNIGLINAILEGDENAGDFSNPIKLLYLDNEIMNLLNSYINFHKDKDYSVDKDPKKGYNDKMIVWDRVFIKSIFNEKRLFKKILKIVNYLMYDTLLSKMLCTIANSESYVDYINLFNELHSEDIIQNEQ